MLLFIVIESTSQYAGDIPYQLKIWKNDPKVTQDRKINSNHFCNFFFLFKRFFHCKG